MELSIASVDSASAAIGFAGDTLNTAIYLKRSAPETEVSYVTRLGADGLSDRMVSMIREEGIRTDLIGRDPDRLPGLYAISTDDAGERSFMYWRANSAARDLFSLGEPEIKHLSQFGVVYFSAISLAVLATSARERLLEWLPSYRESGGIVAFDSNYRPSLWRDQAEAQATVEAVWKNTDIALPSLDDEMALFGDQSEAEVLDRLWRFGVRSGALKRGHMGPLPLDRSPVIEEFGSVAEVVDSTAAGDSFNGGYLAARLRGRPEGACLLEGHALASRVIGVRGAILPRPREVSEIAS